MRKEYVGYLIAVISILLSGVISWYFYEKSLKFRDPIYVSEVFPDQIYNVDENKKTPFHVVLKNGQSINNNIYLIKHYLWNKGNQPILKSEILKPIEVAVLNKGVSILSVEVDRSSREFINCSLSNISKDKKLYTVNFDVLEQYDGCSIKIFYSGDKSFSFSVAGAVIGVGKIKTYSETWETLYKKRAWYHSDAKHLGPLILIIIIGFFIYRDLRIRIESRSILSFTLFLVMLFLIHAYLVISDMTEYSLGIEMNETPFTNEWVPNSNNPIKVISPLIKSNN